MEKPVVINGEQIESGTRRKIELTLPRLYTETPITLPIHVICGKKPGPRLFLTAAVHGDELNGIEIIRRVLKLSRLRNLQGCLIAIPIVNVYGVIQRSRYLPDRRDLNRCFPGSERGSLAGRLAQLLTTEVFSQCTHGIDLHTGSLYRANLPQIRANLKHRPTARLARQFGVPVLIHARVRDGSLRETAVDCGAQVLLYEAGEALRFDELAIRAGVRGIVRIMEYLGILQRKSLLPRPVPKPFIAHSSSWLRAPESGVFQPIVHLGDRVQKGQSVAHIASPFGNEMEEVTAHRSGMIIGQSMIPLIHEGEAIFHIASFKNDEEVVEEIDQFQVGQSGPTALETITEPVQPIT